MRIIKRGKKPAEVEHEKTCSKCDTIFAYQEKDVKPDRDGAYVECPVCKGFIAV